MEALGEALFKWAYCIRIFSTHQWDLVRSLRKVHLCIEQTLVEDKTLILHTLTESHSPGDEPGFTQNMPC
ncbi:hypothetical protein N8T08_007702 [Aspergillus melleus]|uniref:Uncharacterized protein n=1 Tax=Aspergillus melleus TaxID=138277 RepID=A0ACC3BEQ4_9EURO|nr:hypothetical protein N8T08_007702 [Aspergillus melleus]